jgi:hypothetical protein
MQDTTKYEIGDLVQWIDPLYDLFDDPSEKARMKVYGVIIGFNKEHPKVFWFDKLDMNSYFMESDQIVLVSKANKDVEP